MEKLSVRVLAANAYRVLGLPATASQEQVNQAARRLRIWRDPKHIPPTPWDLPALGQVQRSANDVEQALSRLDQPLSRASERLLWFHTQSACAAGETIDALQQACDIQIDPLNPATLHDTALASLHAALALDPDVSDGTRWERAINGFAELAEWPEYIRWMREVELRGDFEKRTQENEIEIAIRALPESIAELALARVRGKLDDGKLVNCNGIIRILGTAGMPALQRRLWGYLEDALERHCRFVKGELERRVVTNSRKWFHSLQDTNCKVAIEATRIYRDTIEPLHRLMINEAHEAGNIDRSLRARTTVTTLLAALGKAWAWAGEPEAADKFFAIAIDLALGTSLATYVRKLGADNARTMASHNADRTARRPRATMLQIAVVLVTLLVAFLVWSGVSQDVTSLLESPTPLALGTLSHTYHGQPRVVLTGRWEVQRAVRIDKGLDDVEFLVPLVAPDARFDDPVEVFVSQGTLRYSQAMQKLGNLTPAPGTTIDGELINKDFGRTFLGVKATSPHFTFKQCDNVGSGTGSALIYFGIWALIAYFEVAYLRRAAKRRVARKLVNAIAVTAQLRMAKETEHNCLPPPLKM